ncbi:hypothetical protein ACG3QT_01925 [Pseudomonas paraeruginosa]
MQVHIWKRREGDIVTLKLASDGDEHTLLQQLRDEGIEADLRAERQPGHRSLRACTGIAEGADRLGCDLSG